MKKSLISTCIAISVLSVSANVFAAPKPVSANGKLKIFILSGQSNMVGFGQLVDKAGLPLNAELGDFLLDWNMEGEVMTGMVGD
jgi:hypothetical protein